MALGNFCFLCFRVSFVRVFPITSLTFLSSQSPIVKAGSAVAGLNSTRGTPFCLNVLGNFGKALLSGILLPGESVTAGATADIGWGLFSCLAHFAASQAGCFVWWPPLALWNLWRLISCFTHTTYSPNTRSDIGLSLTLSNILCTAWFIHQCDDWILCAPRPSPWFQILYQLHGASLFDRLRHWVWFASVFWS